MGKNVKMDNEACTRHKHLYHGTSDARCQPPAVDTPVAPPLPLTATLGAIPSRDVHSIRFTGCWRVYYNARSAAPLIWSIDRGDVSTEIEVREIHFVNVSALSRFNSRANNITEPRAWIEGCGSVDILEGTATINGVWRPC